MPYAAKRPCTVCGKLGQCPQHKHNRSTTTPPTEPPARVRPKTAARGYGGKWQSARKGYLVHHPYCVLCKERGRTVIATVIDHILPHRGDMTLFWDVQGNWRALCKSCHDQKTANEDSHRGTDGKWGSARR